MKKIKWLFLLWLHSLIFSLLIAAKSKNNNPFLQEKTIIFYRIGNECSRNEGTWTEPCSRPAGACPADDKILDLSFGTLFCSLEALNRCWYFVSLTALHLDYHPPCTVKDMRTLANEFLSHLNFSLIFLNLHWVKSGSAKYKTRHKSKNTNTPTSNNFLIKNNKRLPSVNTEFDCECWNGESIKIFCKHPRNDKYLRTEFYWIVFLFNLSLKYVFFWEALLYYDISPRFFSIIFQIKKNCFCDKPTEFLWNFPVQRCSYCYKKHNLIGKGTDFEIQTTWLWIIALLLVL